MGNNPRTGKITDFPRVPWAESSYWLRLPSRWKCSAADTDPSEIDIWKLRLDGTGKDVVRLMGDN